MVTGQPTNSSTKRNQGSELSVSITWTRLDCGQKAYNHVFVDEPNSEAMHGTLTVPGHAGICACGLDGGWLLREACRFDDSTW